MKTKAWIIKNYDLFCLMNVDHNCGRENNEWVPEDVHVLKLPGTCKCITLYDKGELEK